ncbi:MAG: alpha/beta fold hydrolase [Rhizobium sp.]|nr:alpha/beta fold hydrolase [Rhizobium sp.]
MFAASAFLILSIGLTGCGTRPGPEVLETVSAVPDDAKQVRVYAVTTRNRINPDSNVFDAGKATAPNYAELTVSIPPTHKPSQIEWPKGRKANPAKDFAVTGQAVLSEAAFREAIHPGKAGSNRVGIFVHGYNYNFQESLFRLAQISHDARLDGTPILFSWPSQAAVAGYVADKESATYSRDYLAALMTEAVAGRSDKDVMVFGHSMGGWLVVEALRQLKLQGRDDVLAKLNVVLAAPDIDEDVFRTQMAVIGKMKNPMTILVSGDDRALAVSRLISASSNRVGTLNVNDPKVQQAAVASGVTLIDISQVEPSDSAHHNRFVDLVGLYPSLAAGTEDKGLRKAGAFVFDAAGATISSPFRIVSGALNQ